MLDRAPDLLRADFQRFYGLDLDTLGNGLRVRRAADLAANLPEQALVWRALDPRRAWDTTQYLLANIADNTGMLAWTKTKDATRRGARFTGQIPRPGAGGANRQKGGSFDTDETRRLLAMPRRAAG